MQTNDSLILAYLNNLEINQGRSQQTVDAYFRQLSRLEEYLVERGRSLLIATQEDLDYFTGRHLHDLGVSPRSRRQAIAAVRGVFKFAVKAGAMSHNPAAGITYPATGRRTGDLMALRDLEKLLMSIDLDDFIGVRDSAIITLLAGTGIRVGGLVALNRSSVVFTADENGNEMATLRVREKGDHERLVPIPDDCRLSIRAYLGHPEHQLLDCSLPDGDQVLFVNLRHPWKAAMDNVGESRRLTPGGVRYMLKKRGEHAGVSAKTCHPHALRHLYGTELLESGIDSTVIGSLMGHKDPKSTKVYLHLAQRLRRDAVTAGNPLAKIGTPFSALSKALRG